MGAFLKRTADHADISYQSLALIRIGSSRDQPTTAIASISIIHSGNASALTPTSVLAGGGRLAKKAPRALPITGRISGV